MKKILAALMAALMILSLCACGEKGGGSGGGTEKDAKESTPVEEKTELLPGVLADFTADATKPLQDEYKDDNTEATGTKYAVCFYDWNGDGKKEFFYLMSQGASDGVTDLGGITAFVGTDDDPDSLNGSYLRDYIADIDSSAVTFVGWVDFDADDGKQELVISAKKPDGTEQTLICNSNYWHMGSGSDRHLYDGAFKSWADGVLTIGDVQYGFEEGNTLFKPLEELGS